MGGRCSSPRARRAAASVRPTPRGFRQIHPRKSEHDEDEDRDGDRRRIAAASWGRRAREKSRWHRPQPHAVPRAEAEVGASQAWVAVDFTAYASNLPQFAAFFRKSRLNANPIKAIVRLKESFHARGCLVLGGGIVGTALALSLAMKGRSVAMIEKGAPAGRRPSAMPASSRAKRSCRILSRADPFLLVQYALNLKRKRITT